MSTLAVQTDERVKDVHFTDETIGVDLMDGRTITHWEAIDEDLSTEGMLRGAPAPKRK
jgi:hypothetical protein